MVMASVVSGLHRVSAVMALTRNVYVPGLRLAYRATALPLAVCHWRSSPSSLYMKNDDSALA